LLDVEVEELSPSSLITMKVSMQSLMIFFGEFLRLRGLGWGFLGVSRYNLWSSLTIRGQREDLVMDV